MRARVGVVVLNWNGGAANLLCLRSLARAGLAGERVIFVDNGSCDGSAEAVEREFPTVVTLRNRANLGFCAGTNAGLRLALERGDEAVLCLNNDVTVEEGFLGPLLEAFEDPAVGAAGPKMLFSSNPERIWCAGGKIDHRQNLSRLRGWGRPDDGRFDELMDVDYIPGCALLLRARALREIGLFDERFFAYMEDVDLGARLRSAGHRVLYVPAARIYHDAGSSSGGGYSTARKYANALNSVLFLRKHPSWRGWLGLLLFDILGLPFAFARECLRGENPLAVCYKGLGIMAAIAGHRVSAATFERGDRSRQPSP